MKGAVLAILLSASALHGQAGAGTDLVEKIYAKLAVSFSAAEALGKDGDFLILAHPGIPLTAAHFKDAYEISLLADQIPRPQRLFAPSGSCFSSTYLTILERSEASLFQNQKDRFEALKARRLIYDKNRPGKPTAAYADYLTYRAAHRAAEDALILARTENAATGKPVPAGLQQAADEALKTWETQGNRKLIEDAQASLLAFYNANVQALFANLYAEASTAERRDGHPEPYFPVTATPPPETWQADAGWIPFSVTHTEKSLASAPPALPLGGGNVAPQALPADFTSTVSLSLETRRVTFDRPWMDEGIFSSRGWRLLPNAGFSCVSTGNPADKDPGIMPLIVTGVLLSRKARMSGVWKSGTPLPKAVGPFSLTGGAASGSSRNGETTLTADGIQVLGFFCKALPKSPNPDAKAFRSQ